MRSAANPAAPPARSVSQGVPAVAVAANAATSPAANTPSAGPCRASDPDELQSATIGPASVAKASPAAAPGKPASAAPAISARYWGASSQSRRVSKRPSPISQLAIRPSASAGAAIAQIPTSSASKAPENPKSGASAVCPVTRSVAPAVKIRSAAFARSPRGTSAQSTATMDCARMRHATPEKPNITAVSAHAPHVAALSKLRRGAMHTAAAMARPHRPMKADEKRWVDAISATSTPNARTLCNAAAFPTIAHRTPRTCSRQRETLHAVCPHFPLARNAKGA